MGNVGCSLQVYPQAGWQGICGVEHGLCNRGLGSARLANARCMPYQGWGRRWRQDLMRKRLQAGS